MAMKKISLALAAVLMVSSLAACGGEKKKEEAKDYSGMKFTVGAYRDLRTDPYNNSYSIGADKFTEKYPGSEVEFAIHKNNEELVTAIASGDVWDVQMSIMSPTVTVFRQDNIFEPLDDYIDKNNSIYTKALMDEACVYNGKTYGISNVMMSDVLYCVYNEDMYNDYGVKTPYEYYDEGGWNWDNFLKMVDDMKKNNMPISIQWTRPFLDKRYGVKWNDDYTVSSQYTGQDQRDWLNFVRTLVYEKGIGNTKGQALTPATRDTAFVLQIIPHALVATMNAAPTDTIRYIPWVSKDGSKDSTYIVDYHFCVPVGAKSIDGSVELANYMIEACTEDRKQMYKDNMTEDDYNLFMESLDDFYTVRDVQNYWTNETDLINSFAQGKTAAQHISEVQDMLQKACDDHNALVAEKKAGGSSATAAPAN